MENLAFLKVGMTICDAGASGQPRAAAAANGHTQPGGKESAGWLAAGWSDGKWSQEAILGSRQDPLIPQAPHFGKKKKKSVCVCVHSMIMEQ